MNSETGKVYQGEDIDKARARGETLVPVSERVYKATIRYRMKASADLREERRRKKRRQQKASRKANR